MGSVKYKVNGEDYKISEGIKKKSSVYRFKGISIGQQKTEYIKEGRGDYVTIKYNPDNPRQAYIKGNGKKRGG